MIIALQDRTKHINTKKHPQNRPVRIPVVLLEDKGKEAPPHEDMGSQISMLGPFESLCGFSLCAPIPVVLQTKPLIDNCREKLSFVDFCCFVCYTPFCYALLCGKGKIRESERRLIR